MLHLNVNDIQEPIENYFRLFFMQRCVEENHSTPCRECIEGALLFVRWMKPFIVSGQIILTTPTRLQSMMDITFLEAAFNWKD
ncbi:MAG: hypothetical protein ACREBJ_03380 [Nitrosotalea sp.]